MPKAPITDINTESQVIDQPNRRTIYDAKSGEIFWKSFVAGMGLGIGRMVATLIFFGIILGLFVTYLEPWLMNVVGRVESSFPTFFIGATKTDTEENNALNRYQYNDAQFLDIFSSFRSQPQENTEASGTTTTTQ